MQARERQEEPNVDDPHHRSAGVQRSRSATLVAVAGAFVAAMTLAACGGSRPAHKVTAMRVAAGQSRKPANPGAVVVRIGPYSITGTTVNRFLSAEIGNQAGAEQLLPPTFTACVAHLEGGAAARGERSPGPSQLRSECQARYRAALQAVLTRVITNAWLIGGSRELGVAFSDSEVKASFDMLRREKFRGKAQFKRFLAGRTVGEVVFETRARLASEAIRRAIRDRVRPIAQTQITSYYRSHRWQFLVAGARDVKIVHIESASSAAKVKAELASGTSFANVVRKLPDRQPFGSSEGLALELGPHTYGEPSLNQAIFTAKRGVLSGPVSTSFGYFVFEVVNIRFERVKPLADVEAAIRDKLARPLQEQALARFTKQWRARWTARTDCAPGDVVPGCRQFKSSAGEAEGLPTVG